MKQTLVEKYRPEHPDDIVGHPSAIDDITDWAKEWESGDVPLLLYGPAGTGKTSTAEAISNYVDWGYFEINASETRTTEDIETLTQQIRSQSGNPRLFVLDEIDSIDGRSLSSLYKILEDAPNPIICTANEKWKVPDGLENKCKCYKYNLQQRSIKSFLRNIAEKEDIDISNRQIGQLATRNGIRDALNDLQHYMETGETDWDSRETDDSPFAVTRRAILGKDYLGDMTPDDMVAFLAENVTDEFDGVEEMRAYQALAEADRWLGHVNRTQDYSWWAVAGPIAEEVANLRITEPYNDWVNVNYPSTRYNHTPKPSDDSQEAMLFKEIKAGDGYVAAFDYNEFRTVVLPLLTDLNKNQKKDFALSYSLSDKAMRALDLSKSEFEDWQMKEIQNDSDVGSKETTLEDFINDSASSENDEERGLFDY